MTPRRGLAVLGLFGVSALLLLGFQLKGQASGGVQLEASIEPLAGPLQIVLDEPAVIRAGKWTKLSATVTNQTGVFLDNIQVVLHVDGGVLALRSGPQADVRALKPGASTAAKWAVRCDQPAFLVIVATARGTTTVGHEIDAVSDAVILRVEATARNR